MKKSYENIIIAPHPDDELIGCYEILTNKTLTKKVILFKEWFNENLQDRIKESQQLADEMEYEIIIVKNILQSEYFNIITNITKPSIVWIPSLQDNNPHHSYTNIYTKLIIEYTKSTANDDIIYIGEYTTKMNTDYKRLTNDPNDKKTKLYKYFPSQKDYFNNFNDLYIFEGRIILQ